MVSVEMNELTNKARGHFSKNVVLSLINQHSAVSM